ncbi:hypothetical protein [Alienimonas californiensis]|uniref:Uncharacterized protein n=1 Tax=Alienimonas californiensis TaxID=2527989 RepID=A0A517P9F8_9PLAN|nr:hypothetical protein [Alienimonas californiensis]QDT16004.1 hypothetical protein CA12_21020 [Alienimonas californiensis]
MPLRFVLPSLPRSPRTLPGALLAATLLTGCGEEEDPIAVYTVPALEQTDPAAVPATPPAATPPFAPFAGGAAGGGMTGVQTPDEPQRLLGAIATARADDGALWYFKLNGPVAAVEAAEEDFGAWLETVTFADGEPTWTTPEGWTEQPGSGMRAATLLTPDGTEATVIRLGVSGDLDERIDADVERWRGQVGATGDAGTVEEVTLADGSTAQLLSVSTPAGAMGGETASSSPAKPQASVKPPAEAVPFEYKRPEGWSDEPAPATARLAFATGDGEDAARATISEFPAGAMALPDLVGIVAEQSGTGAWNPQEDAGPITVGGADAVRIELPAKEDGPTVLAAALTRGESLWLFKLIGDQEAVAAATPAFEAFLADVRFTDTNNEGE